METFPYVLKNSDMVCFILDILGNSVLWQIRNFLRFSKYGKRRASDFVGFVGESLPDLRIWEWASMSNSGKKRRKRRTVRHDKMTSESRNGVSMLVDTRDNIMTVVVAFSISKCVPVTNRKDKGGW